MPAPGMHMDRSARRVLAFALAVVGFGGLAIAASGILPWLGLTIAALALLALLAVAWVALDSSAAMPELQPEPTWDTLPESAPVTDVGFEYGEADMFPEEEDEQADEELPTAPPTRTSRRGAEPVDMESPLQRALAGLPPKPAAPARYSARMPVIPEEEQERDEPVKRARRLVPSGQTLGEKREAAKKAKAKPAADEEMEFTVVADKPRPTKPRVVATEKVPLMVARKAGRGAVPTELAQGKCGGCGTLLWAPKTRPVNLRCPECDKITLLR
jgi:hypothetical protein